MKLRIKGNSIRLRLTKTDVMTLKNEKMVGETTTFSPSSTFVYRLRVDTSITNVDASFIDSLMEVRIGEEIAQILTHSDEITVEGTTDNGLYILVEKDLKCLDNTTEDQSDMYPNPNSTC